MILKITYLDGTERLGASIGGGGSGPGLVLGRTEGSFWFWWQTGDVLRGGGGVAAATDDGEEDAAAFGEAVDSAGDNGGLGEAEEDSFSSSVSLLGCNSLDGRV